MTVIHKLKLNFVFAYFKYENLISQFIETHRNYDHLMSTQHTTADLKQEIEKMEEEKEQIIKRLERVKKRVRIKI